MTHYSRGSMGRECPQTPDNPADQPKPPGDGKACCKVPQTTPPTLEPPAPCPDPPACCKCPSTPGSTSNCLEALIEKQATDVAAVDQANKFKAELAKLLEATRKASQEYTRDKYEKLVVEWTKQDAEITELIRKLVCAVSCWRCIIDCYVCPLLNELHYAEKWLRDDGKMYNDVYDLYDLQYWHTKDKAAKERRFNRVKSVLAAWESPAKTIEKALTDNKALIEAMSPLIGPQPGKAIFDVFLRLVPMHLAIAPPKGSNWTTKIDKHFTQFCECNQGEPDYCCGPDVGEWSLRQRLIGPQAYLIDPNDYYMLICCLVEQRYAPANEALSKAATDLANVTDRIARYETQFKDGWVKNFETAAKGAIPSVIECCDYDSENQNAQKSKAY